MSKLVSFAEKEEIAPDIEREFSLCGRAYDLFDMGLSTMDIAKSLGVSEARALMLVTHGRCFERGLATPYLSEAV